MELTDKKTLSDVDEKTQVSSEALTVEDIFEGFGFGRFQTVLSLVVIVYIVFNSSLYMSMVFVAQDVPFVCEPSNINSSLIPENFTFKEFLDKLNSNEGDKCSRFELQLNQDVYEIPTVNSTKVKECKKRIYDTSDVSSIVSEYDLSCERRLLTNTMYSSIFGGCLTGVFLFGFLSDRYGRHPLFFIGQLIMVVSNFARNNSPSLLLFNILYFFEGMGKAGSYACTYTLLIEILSLKQRMPLNFLHHGAFSTGNILLAGYAYFIRDWHYLQYVLIIPHLIFFMLWKWLPESPRWLLGRQNFKRAELGLQRIAKANKKDMAPLIQRICEAESMTDKSLQHNRIDKKNCTIIDIVRNLRTALMSINIWFSWLVNSMLYYGVSMNSVAMGGNPYLNYFFMSFIEIPAAIVCTICFKYFGHRKPIAFFMVFGGINCILSNFVPQGSYWFPLILAVLGKFGATASFDGIYLLAAEIFPTVIRASCMGISSIFGRIGAVSAPVILGLSSLVSWLPLTIFGIGGITSGLLLLLLPEVSQTVLPETVEDMANL
ncbi:organic cation transporter protein-like [Argonauta hians]